MNTNDLPPAAKLAALIEAGRAANPDLKHGRGCAYDGLAACALGFAALGAGVPRSRIGVVALRSIDPALSIRLAEELIRANDLGRLPLDEIILSLREGELAKVPA